MEVLPDIVGTEPRIVFCGMARADSTTTARPLLRVAGQQLLGDAAPERADRPAAAPGGRPRGRRRTGWGSPTSSRPAAYDLDVLAAKVEGWQPEWLAFTSKTVANAAARMLGVRPPGLGPCPWELERGSVFVLPGTSGANRRRDYDGRPGRLSVVAGPGGGRRAWPRPAEQCPSTLRPRLALASRAPNAVAPTRPSVALARSRDRGSLDPFGRRRPLPARSRSERLVSTRPSVALARSRDRGLLDPFGRRRPLAALADRARVSTRPSLVLAGSPERG